MKVMRKLKSRGGFSLAECLVTLVILSLMSMVACMGISTAFHDRAQSITVANAQTVASTAAQAVADQIRYGQIIQVEDRAIVLESSTYGAQVRLTLNDRGHLIVQSLSAGPAGSAPSYALLGEKAYGGLALDQLKFETLSDGGIRIGLSVGTEPAADDEDAEHRWSLEYTVTPLNPHIPSGA